MTTFITPHDVAEEVDHEHRRIGQLFERISCSLSSGRSHLPVVRSLLGELSELLQRHFAREEEGGYYQDIVEMSPRFSSQVDELREQHGTLLDSVAQLRLHVNCAPDASLWWRAIRYDFAEFARLCREHEQQEHKLVQLAYTQDIGAMD